MSKRNEQVVSEALCRNHLSGFAEVCASGCGDCTFPGQPHPCEHALAVWGSDAQEILRALPAHDGMREALEHQQWSVITEAIERYSDGRQKSDLVALGIVAQGVLILDELRRAALSTKQEGEACDAAASPIASKRSSVPAFSAADLTEIVEQIVRDVSELPDRTSPDDAPTMMLVSGDELAAIVSDALLDAAPPGAVSPTPEERGCDAVLAELKRLYRAYVGLLELGRNRIIDLGGTCDAVDVMEDGDPALRSARAIIKQAADVAAEEQGRSEPLRTSEPLRGKDRGGGTRRNQIMDALPYRPHPLRTRCFVVARGEICEVQSNGCLRRCRQRRPLSLLGGEGIGFARDYTSLCNSSFDVEERAAMGREIRRVPANWDHPVTTRSNGREGKQPMHNETYAEARVEWLEGLRKWEAGEDPDREKYKNDDDTYADWWEWNGEPPNREYYRPWQDHEAVWFQLWETVSEGTPVTPPFATEEELAQYLADNGDEWDQQHCLDRDACRLFGMQFGKPGWGIERARAFVNAGWAPSMVVTNGQVLDSKDVPLAMKQEGGR